MKQLIFIHFHIVCILRQFHPIHRRIFSRIFSRISSRIPRGIHCRFSGGITVGDNNCRFHRNSRGRCWCHRGRRVGSRRGRGHWCWSHPHRGTVGRAMFPFTAFSVRQSIAFRFIISSAL